MAKTKKPKHIAVAGNIGAGKTTLTELLSKHYRWIPQFEDVDHNPYLFDFYEDMPRWSFNLQIYFLNSRLKQLNDIHRGTETIVQDRTIYEDAYIFAPNLHEMGLMPDGIRLPLTWLSPRCHEPLRQAMRQSGVLA